MLHKLNPKFEFLHDFFENYKPNWQGMVQTSFRMWLCTLVQNLRSIIWIMLGELLIHKFRGDVYMINSHIYLNFESGLVYIKIVYSSLLFESGRVAGIYRNIVS